MGYTSEEAAQVAKTILEQLGGRKFLMMTGAKHLMSHPDGALSFKLPIGKYNHCKIVLTEMDEYDVHFQKLTRQRRAPFALNCSREERHEGIYCDQLAQIFEKATGLRTSLGTMGRQEVEA